MTGSIYTIHILWQRHLHLFQGSVHESYCHWIRKSSLTDLDWVLAMPAILMKIMVCCFNPVIYKYISLPEMHAFIVCSLVFTIASSLHWHNLLHKINDKNLDGLLIMVKKLFFGQLDHLGMWLPFLYNEKRKRPLDSFQPAGADPTICAANC